MKKVIQDVADVIIRDKETGMVVATTEAQMSSIEQTISEEDLRGGIGNGRVFLIRSDKTINLTMRSATFDPLYMAITQGVEAKSKTVAVTRAKTGEVDADGKIKLPYKPMSDATVTARSLKTGKQIILEPSAIADKEVTVPTADADSDKALALKAGDKVTIVYKITVQGESITFDSSKFSKKYEVEYRTIAYDQDTGRPDTELYFIFPEVIPSGAFTMSLENGSVYTPEFTLSVNAPVGSTEMGEFISVPVGELDEEGNPILPEGNEEATAKQALGASIDAAEEAKTEVEVSTDGTDVPTTSMWVKQDDVDTLDAAIAVAESVKGSSDDVTALKEAKTTLDTAVSTFNNKAQAGTQS